jgi:hypothetical protein
MRIRKLRNEFESLFIFQTSKSNFSEQYIIYLISQSCQLHDMKHCCSACCGESRLRRSLITKPAFENCLSLGTEVAGMPKSMRATGANDGYLPWCCDHHWSDEQDGQPSVRGWIPYVKHRLKLLGLPTSPQVSTGVGGITAIRYRNKLKLQKYTWPPVLLNAIPS